ncbi:MAG: hypothetical protein KBT10_10360 [Bacteroidales bacterium]|nr:hypothetical protein [Candidatus Sodaliphilus aphodohippi]
MKVVLNMPTFYGEPIVDLQGASIRLYNKNDAVWFDTWEMVDNVMESEAPLGTYSLLMQFQIMMPFAPEAQGCTDGIIVKENISISKDTTITINFADAKNVVYMEKKLPNGEAFCDGDFDERVMDFVTMPNAQSLFADMSLVDKNYGELAIYKIYPFEGDYILETGDVLDQRYRVLVSDMSDRYTLTQSYTAYRFDEEQNNFYTITSEVSGINESKNIACSGTYETVSTSFKPSILGNNSNYLRPHACVMRVNETGSIGISSATVTQPDGLKMPFKMNVCNGNLSKIKYYCNTSLLEYIDKNTYTNATLFAPLAETSDNEVKFQVISPTVIDFTYNSKPDGNISRKPNSTFSFKASELTDNFGNNTPINVFGCNSTEMGMKIHNPVSNYVGRMGECRQTDNYNLKYSLSYNSEEICNDFSQIQMGWLQQWIYSGEHPDGVFDVAVVNKNMMVDDMQGCNTTKVHYDTRNEDFTPPTVMMLQFRNTEDNSVTDRFENGDKAAMYLAAKDYTLGLNENWAMAMECRPVNVKVSYAANGMDEWTELDINEMPELFDEYAFGYIYGTTLDQVNCTSENKWYDLKIEVSDEAGNWQEQVVSPAFRINDAPTGITGVKVGNATEVGRYTVDGRAISTPQSGVNIIKMSDGSVKKVWVK